MLKFLAAIALSLSLVFFVKEAVIALRAGSLPVSSVKKVREDKQQKIYPAEKEVNFYPKVPVPLPDLNRGYLFNEERILAIETDESSMINEEETVTASIDMDTVFYAGSVIVGNVRKGLVMYINPRFSSPKRRDSSIQAASPIKERKYVQLSVGGYFSGYKVVRIEADRIIFRKGEESLEKMLNDSKKIRLAVPAPLKEKIDKQTTAPQEAASVPPVESKSGSAAQSAEIPKKIERQNSNTKIRDSRLQAAPENE